MKSNSPGKLLRVLIFPTVTFRSLKQDATWGFALGAGVMAVVAATYITVLKLPADGLYGGLAEAMWKSGRTMSQHELARLKSATFYLVAALSGGSVVLWLSVRALLTWVVLKTMGVELSLKASMSTTVYASAPLIMFNVLMALVVLLRGTVTVDEFTSRKVLISNLAALCSSDASKAQLMFLSQIDVFVIWSLVLTVIGYSVVAGVSKRKAAAATIPLWLTLTGMAVFLAELGG